jgi:hypothetical protein
MAKGVGVRKLRTCRACAEYGHLYQDRLFPDALLALQAWRPTQPGRPATYVDRRLRTRGQRATARWVRHLRASGPHILSVPDEILRRLAERLLHIVRTHPRVGDGVLVWLALKHLVRWNPPTGRYRQTVDRLLDEWRAEDFQAWWNGPAGKSMQRALYNHEITTRNQQPRRALLVRGAIDELADRLPGGRGTCSACGSPFHPSDFCLNAGAHEPAP